MECRKCLKLTDEAKRKFEWDPDKWDPVKEWIERHGDAYPTVVRRLEQINKHPDLRLRELSELCQS